MITLYPGLLLLPWAKRRIDPPREVLYPLLFHMIDVSTVTEVLWHSCLHRSARRFCSAQLGLTEAEAGGWIAFWAAMHDLGKASPGFQGKSASARGTLGRHLSFPRTLRHVPHGTITSATLPEQLESHIGNAEVRRRVAIAVGGHHGVFPNPTNQRDAVRYKGGATWEDIRAALFESIAEISLAPGLPSPRRPPDPSFYMFLAGLTSVADWIASNDTYYPYEVEHPVEDHLAYSKGQAHKALKDLGWTGWRPPSDDADIKDLFPHIKETRPLQDEAGSLSRMLKGSPALVLIEAPTGEGKTEAAMCLADGWAVGLGQKGCYFALPTMATSDQMFGRVKDYLDKRYHDERVNLMLLHGHAALSAEFADLKNRPADYYARGVSGDEGYDGAPAAVVASEWFTYRKRGLLAPFGVGTIDQVLLAVLQTRHVFVRLFGLASKTIVVDEVHAYDAYMTSLLERLLEWLAALGSPVVMLSATLPGARREAMLKAYAKGLGNKDLAIPVDVSETQYPRISSTTGAECRAVTFSTSSRSAKSLCLRWVSSHLDRDGGGFELGRDLQERLSGGGCCAVICNTIGQAQQVYMALKPYFPGQDAGDGWPELDLLHARYVFGERRRREERTRLRFGKPEEKVLCEDGTERPVCRPHRAVLVATQVIEQSLDIDFDLMATEMAPVDLLLQRAGRLHRHQRERPEKLDAPFLWISRPAVEGGLPRFGSGTEAIYDLHVLLRSWLALFHRSSIGIPDEVEQVIEQVYDDRQCPDGLPEAVRKEWIETRHQRETDIEREQSEADDRWIKPPGYTGGIWRVTYDPREEDDPSLHKAHQALTRLTGETVRVLCLYGTGGRLFIDAEQAQPVEANLMPGYDMTRQLLRCSLTLSQQGLVQKVIASERNFLPKPWREVPLLRHYRLLVFDRDAVCRDIDGFHLRLDDELGLVIDRTSSGGEHVELQSDG